MAINAMCDLELNLEWKKNSSSKGHYLETWPNLNMGSELRNSSGVQLMGA